MVKPSRYIKDISPYSITTQEVWSSTKREDPLKADWNEAPFLLDFYKSEIEKIIKEESIFSWYSDYSSRELNEEIAKFLDISEGNILTFPGSDTGLETLCRAFLEPKEKVAVITPTYENFFIYVHQTGAQLKKYELKPPFNLNFDHFRDYISSLNNLKAIYLVNPNNPCGYSLDRKELLLLSESFPDVLFIIDEAYIEFSEEESASLINKNVVVFRTFSKAFGLAGIRLGYAVADHDIIKTLAKIRNGKNISMLAQRLGIAALKNIDLVTQWICEVKRSRSIFINWCEENQIKYYPSQGNFVLLSIKDEPNIVEKLRSRNIFVRDRKKIINNGFRVTIGSEDHTHRIINELDRIIK